MSKYFKGYYYKHQKGANILSVIAGETSEEKFLQVITKEDSYYIPHQNGCTFSGNGMNIDTKHKNICLKGKVTYSNITPIKYDIMGPFKFIPMECKHEIVSMNHRVDGGFTLNGKFLDFTNGNGYIEGDKGTSFPRSYLWVQCNNFEQRYSIVASVADIPLGLMHFKGCICNINYLGKEYRLATYLGARVIQLTRNKLIVKQRKYELVVDILNPTGQKLVAPVCGKMDKHIYEDISCTAVFRFYIKGQKLFDITNSFTSFEFVV